MIIDSMIMYMKISINSFYWRIAVSISVALMIIKNMVFTILLHQREANILRFTQRHELGHGLFHLGDEYNYSTVPVAEANLHYIAEYDCNKRSHESEVEAVAWFP